MKVTALHTNARITPRKVRPVSTAVVGLPVVEADHQLQWMNSKAAQLVREVLRSAVANANHNYDIEQANLKVASIQVDAGWKFKRFQPVSRGSAHPYVKRTAHIKVIVEEIKESGKKKTKKTEIETLSIDDLKKGPAAQPAGEKVTTEEQAPTSAATASKREQATGIVKANQQGGDKNKSHRRKSM